MNVEQKARKIVKEKIPHFGWLVTFSFVVSVLLKFSTLIPGWLMRQIVDVYIPQGQIKNCITYIFLFACIPLCIAIANAFYKFVIIVVGRNMSKKLSVLGFEKQVYQSITYFNKHKSAELAAYCRSESTKYILFWVMDIPQLVSSVLAGILIFVYVSYINIYWGLTLLLYVPLLLFPNKIFSDKIEKNARKIRKNNSVVNQIITDTFKAIKNVKIFSLEKIMVEKVSCITGETATIFAKTAAIENLYGTWTTSFLDNLFSGVLFAAGAIFVIRGDFTIGTLIVLMNYMPMIFLAIKDIAHTKMNFKKQMGEYDEFFEMLVVEDERQTDPERLFDFSKEIVFDNVSFAYESARGNVLNHVCFSIQKGQWLGIMGKSGAGKSTVFDLILKLYDGYDGDIKIDDADIKDISSFDLRRKITCVSQDVFLFPGTIRENLLLVAPNATDDELKAVIKEVGLEQFIKNLPQGIDTDIGEDGILISGGEKQRLSLAQGLLRNCEILLLDEVTSSVDAQSEASICETINDLRNKFNLTIISISHRLSFFEHTDAILQIDNGRVVNTVTFKELVERE